MCLCVYKMYILCMVSSPTHERVLFWELVHNSKSCKSNKANLDTKLLERMLDTWTNSCDWTCECTFTSLKVCNLNVHMWGTLYIGMQEHTVSHQVCKIIEVSEVLIQGKRTESEDERA